MDGTLGYVTDARAVKAYRPPVPLPW